MYLDISSMRKPSMGGRQHWVMLVDEATKYKKSFFLKKMNEQVETIDTFLLVVSLFSLRSNNLTT